MFTHDVAIVYFVVVVDFVATFLVTADLWVVQVAYIGVYIAVVVAGLK